MSVFNLFPKQVKWTIAFSLLAYSQCLKWQANADTGLFDSALIPLAPAGVEDSASEEDCDSSEEMKISSLCSSESKEIDEPSAMPLANDMKSLLNDPMGMKEPMFGALLDDAGNPISLDMHAFGGNMGPLDMPINSNVYPSGPAPMGQMIYDLPARVVNLGGPMNSGMPLPPADLLNGADPSAGIPVLYDVDMGGGAPPLIMLSNDPLASLFARLDQQLNQQSPPSEPPLSPTTNTAPSAPVLLDIVKRDKPLI